MDNVVHGIPEVKVGDLRVGAFTIHATPYHTVHTRPGTQSDSVCGPSRAHNEPPLIISAE